jgi:CHAD domain-containing protein
MRTALRASRAALELFEPRLDAMVVGRFDAELQGFGRLFGAARDWDVFCLQTLPAAMLELPAERLWDLKQVADMQRRLADAAVADALCGQPLTAMVLGLAAWTEEGAAQPSKRESASRHWRRAFSTAWQQRRKSANTTKVSFLPRHGTACAKPSINSAMT